MSTTVMVPVAMVVLPAASVAVQVTVVTPGVVGAIGKVDPGVQLGLRAPSTLSVAVAV